MTLSTRAAPAFDFIASDLTRSYSVAKVAQVTREFVWLRPDLLVVHDRVQATDPSYPKRFLLHGQGAFVEAAGDYHVDDGSGRLFLRTLLPTGASTVQVGGSGHEWEVEGVNYPPAEGLEFAGTHRLEISPAAPAAFDSFLHVLQLCDQAIAQMEPSTLLSTAEATGVLVREWVVWFGTRGAISGLSFELDAGHPVHVIVGDLAPSTAYAIQVGARSFTESSDANGVLFFEDDQTGQHVVVVGEGTCPDQDHDGFLDQACGGNDCDDQDPAIHPGAGCGGPDGGADAGSDAGADSTGDGGPGDAVVDGDGDSPVEATAQDTGTGIQGSCGCQAGSASGLCLLLLLGGVLALGCWKHRGKGCHTS
jgi:hypothetical protein